MMLLPCKQTSFASCTDCQNLHAGPQTELGVDCTKPSATVNAGNLTPSGLLLVLVRSFSRGNHGTHCWLVLCRLSHRALNSSPCYVVLKYLLGWAWRGRLRPVICCSHFEGFSTKSSRLHGCMVNWLNGPMAVIPFTG